MHLPFSEVEFFDLFATFNLRFWPVLLGLWAASLLAAVSVARARVDRHLLVLLLATQWAWCGLAYHAWLFTRINPAAGPFAALFVLQALLLAWAGARDLLAFSWEASLRQLAGLFFLAASLAYPLLVLIDGHRFPAAPAFGVPCPTTLFTAGVLLCATPPVPRVLLIAPIAWSIVGGSAALLFGMTPDLLLFAGAASLIPLVLPVAVQRRLQHWWTADTDVARAMAGDRFASMPAYQMTLVRVAAARPRDVWPWLMQLGYRRGGLYSYDWLDRLFGYLDAPSARDVLPQFQQLQPGEVIPMGHGAGFPVQAVEPYRSLVLGGEQQQTRWSWEIALEPVDAIHTRIISRSRGEVPRTLAARVFIALLGPAAFLMTRRMLVGLATRAEWLARESAMHPQAT